MCLCFAPYGFVFGLPIGSERPMTMMPGHRARIEQVLKCFCHIVEDNKKNSLLSTYIPQSFERINLEVKSSPIIDMRLVFHIPEEVKLVMVRLKSLFCLAVTMGKYHL